MITAIWSQIPPISLINLQLHPKIVEAFHIGQGLPGFVPNHVLYRKVFELEAFLGGRNRGKPFIVQAT
jgi:hypothetical protein